MEKASQIWGPLQLCPVAGQWFHLIKCKHVVLVIPSEISQWNLPGCEPNINFLWNWNYVCHRRPLHEQLPLRLPAPHCQHEGSSQQSSRWGMFLLHEEMYWLLHSCLTVYSLDHWNWWAEIITRLSSDSYRWICTREPLEGAHSLSPRCSPQPTCSCSSRRLWAPRWRGLRLSLCRASLRSAWSAWSKGAVGASCNSCPSQWWVMSREDRDRFEERCGLEFFCSEIRTPLRKTWKEGLLMKCRESSFPKDHTLFSTLWYWQNCLCLFVCLFACVRAGVRAGKASCSGQTSSCTIHHRPDAATREKSCCQGHCRSLNRGGWMLNLTATFDSTCGSKEKSKAQLLALLCQGQLETWVLLQFCYCFYIHPFVKV